MTELPVRYARTADGYNIAFTVEGSGPPMVALPSPFHHVLRLREVGGVRGQIERAAKHFTMVHYDHRGQGLSTRGLPGHHRWEDYQLDLEAVVNALELERFSIFAPGFARVAIRFAAMHPERLAGLVLLNPSMNGGRAAAMIDLAENDWDFFVETVARTNIPDQDAGDVIDVFRACYAQEDFVRASRSLSGQDISAYLPQIKSPTLVLAVRQGSNAFASEEDGRTLTQLIPGAELMILDGFGVDRIPPVVDFLRRKTNVFQAPAPSFTAAHASLTQREQQVLSLVVAGRSNQQIADALVMSPSTAAKHVNRILAKTGTANRTEAALYAHRSGLA